MPGERDHAVSPPAQEWAILFYLCGHFNRASERDPFVAALEDIRQAGATGDISAAVYIDLESGARRIAVRPGEAAESESLGVMNSGDPHTLEQFLTWAFDACPARRYVLVMAGLGIMDAESVVGRPPFDTERMFSICDDRATDDAIELHELSAALRGAFPRDGQRRLVLLACDMYAMQFMEVAYELRSSADILLGIQPDERMDAAPLRHWPYGRLLRRWRELLAAPVEGAGPRWRTGVDPHGLRLARETISMLGDHYTQVAGDAAPVTVSAVNLQALGPLAQALDTFSAVYLQWLSNDVIWQARERVFRDAQHMLQGASSYDVNALALAVRAALEGAAAEALVRWAAATLPDLEYPRLSRTLRVFGAAARDAARREPALPGFRLLAAEITSCRSKVERAIAKATSEEDDGDEGPSSADIVDAVRRLFAESPDRLREVEVWTEIITAARDRVRSTERRELADVFLGIEAAGQIARLATRVSELTQPRSDGREEPAIAGTWPAASRCGLSLYRPVDLDKLAQSNYLELRFSRDLHWTALLTAVDLINNHARMLWGLVESQLTAAPLEARYQLMRRLAGDRALTGRHADQLRALSAPDALFLTIEPVDVLTESPVRPSDPRGDVDPPDPIASYCVRLNSLDRSSAVLERRNPVTRERLERVLVEIDAIGAETDAPPERTLQRLARCGSLLGDDILYGISDRLAEVESTDGRPIHLVLQVPRALMRYPWELLRDRRGWLVERFAIGRQVIAEAESVARWSGSQRHGALRLLVVAPAVEGVGAELAGVGAIEGEHVAGCFERLQESLPGLVEPANFREYLDVPVTVEQFRALLREGRYDIVHFAGHGRFDPEHGDRSCWMFSDGPLYAFELRHTLANADVTPWLLYGSACEGSREPGAAHGYHEGVYGMASAALGQGVAAYVGPLWKITDSDAKNLAATFYEALLLRRTSVGEALAFARRSVKEGREDDPGGPAVRSAGWTGMVLYGDPTPTVLQRLSPSESGGGASDRAPREGERAVTGDEGLA